MIRKYLLVLATVLVVVLISITPASAHHPEVSAVNQCITNTPMITVTATAWDTDDATHRVNNEILVTARNTATNESQTVTTSTFNAGNGYSFSVSFVGSSGATYVIRATAMRQWGVNEDFGSAGEFRETTITQQPPCLLNPLPPPPPNTITTTTVPVVAPPTTTVTTTVAPTTTVPPEGIIQQRIEREKVLANTGADYTWLIALGGVTLILVGLMLHLKNRESNG